VGETDFLLFKYVPNLHKMDRHFVNYLNKHVGTNLKTSSLIPNLEKWLELYILMKIKFR